MFLNEYFHRVFKQNFISFWLQDVLKELKVDLDRAKKGKPPLKDSEGKTKKNLSPEA